MGASVFADRGSPVPVPLPLAQRDREVDGETLLWLIGFLPSVQHPFPLQFVNILYKFLYKTLTLIVVSAGKESSAGPLGRSNSTKHVPGVCGSSTLHAHQWDGLLERME